MRSVEWKMGLDIDFKRICGYLCLSIIVGCAIGPVEHEQSITVFVSRVLDGDTVKCRPIRIDHREFCTLRYIGVDTPECGEPYWRAAKELNKSLVYRKRVRLELDSGLTDRYGRLLAYVHIGNLFVNAELVRRGYAKVLTIRPNTRYAALFQQLEKEAKEKQLGIWSRTSNLISVK